MVFRTCYDPWAGASYRIRHGISKNLPICLQVKFDRAY